MITAKTPLKKVLEIGKECSQCGHCCKHGAGFVSKNEIKKLAKHYGVKEETFIRKYLEETTIFNNTVFKFRTRKDGKPYGKCILYDEKKGCTIHRIKPLHCRIGNCKEHGQELSAWFTVNYLVNKNDPESIRQFNLYVKSGGKVLEGGKVKDLIPDKKLLQKILNYEVLK